ncbi:MAG: hypothetical protein ONB27_08975 [candidate division KSB1 bacterium]|nr:hypothetical protein [candidate division KSB1 bacterium]
MKSCLISFCCLAIIIWAIGSWIPPDSFSNFNQPLSVSQNGDPNGSGSGDPTPLPPNPPPTPPPQPPPV